jgi:hypothetical protein
MICFLVGKAVTAPLMHWVGYSGAKHFLDEQDAVILSKSIRILLSLLRNVLARVF